MPIETAEDQMSILVKIKHQYGSQVVVPVCDTAFEFAKIAGTQVLTIPTIESIKKLGYVVQVEQALPKTL